VALQRATDWPEQFAAFIEERRHTPFAWGQNDCALFPADFALRVTGVDFAEGLRGYADEEGARQRVAAAGGMRGLAARLTPRQPAFAQRADVVLAVVDGVETFGLCIGDGMWAAPGAHGLVFRHMSDVVAAFEY